ncbi:MAG: hypothetical protein ACYCZF_10175 [Anaerolineae bacterium]
MPDILFSLLQPWLDKLAGIWQVVLTFLYAILGLVLLLSGRKLYWFFIGLVGFIVGVIIGLNFVTAGGWLRWTLILGLGIGFALLARMAQQLMAVIAGALVLGFLGYMLPPVTWPIAARYVAVAILGFIGAIIGLNLFDWALIIASALLGASLINGAIPQVAGLAGLPPLTVSVQWLVLAGLVVVGIVIQALSLPKKR